VGPLAPVCPAAPCTPEGPVGPATPAGPATTAPGAPVAPARPCSPTGPAGPAAPRGPTRLGLVSLGPVSLAMGILLQPTANSPITANNAIFLHFIVLTSQLIGCRFFHVIEPGSVGASGERAVRSCFHPPYASGPRASLDGMARAGACQPSFAFSTTRAIHVCRVLHPALHPTRVLSTYARQKQASAWCWIDLYKIEHRCGMAVQ
jgi:hypothetical protein